MSQMDITKISKLDLQELTDIKIDANMPIAERMEFFLSDIKNPYCFKVNGTPVKISFANHNKTINDCLYNFLVSKIDNDEII